MAYPAFHDFVALLFVYNDLLKEAANRNMRDKTMDELYHFWCGIKKVDILFSRIS